MSKHSKNNTSGSVFTYAQRQKLKNVYGTIHTRIGQDSTKKFQDCTVCQNKMIEPTACDHGHTFCRSCAIQFLVKQKKRLAEQNKGIDKQNNDEKVKEKEKQLQNQVQRLEKFEQFDNFLNVSQRNGLLRNQKPNETKKQQPHQKIDIIHHVKPTGIYQQNKQKEKYTKSSFWVIENTPQFEQKIQQKSQKFVQCPGPGAKHKLNLKKLRDLKLNELDNTNCCWVCRKQIGKQKIGCYKCGHVVCQKCKSNKCEVCDTTDKWLDLEGNASAFASRNSVEVKTYTHAFIS